MMTTLAPAVNFEIGRVISRLFGVLGRNLGTFALLTVLLVGLPTALVSAVQLSWIAPTFAANPGDPTAVFTQLFAPSRLAFYLGAFVVSVVANAVLQGAIIHGTVTDLAGRRASLGESLGSGLAHILPLFGVGLLAGIGEFFGFILLVVPGVLLALAWSVAAPVVVMERVGVFGAFGRSIELTRNHRGAIFGLFVILFVVQLVLQFVLQAVFGVGVGVSSAASLQGPGLQPVLVVQTLVTVLVRTVIAAVSAAGVASVYYELRQVKEGVGAEQLAAVFD